MEREIETLAQDLDTAGEPGALARGLEGIRRLVAGLAGRGEAVELGRLVSRFYDKLLVRAAWLARDGPDDPAGGYALVVLGSQGRREQFLATDQDNALLLEDPAGQDGPWQAYAARLAAILEAAGMPPCPKGIMAASRQWRGPVSGWCAAIDAAAARPDADGVLYISLLADMRVVAGDPGLVAAVLAHLRRRLAEVPLFTRALAREALRFGPPAHVPGHLPLGLFGFGQGEIDLKRQAVYPLVLGIKALALDALDVPDAPDFRVATDTGALPTDTASRLSALAVKGRISEGLAARLSQAFEHVQSLRLAAQVAAFTAGRPMDNRVSLSRLAAKDKERFRETLGALDELGAILEYHFSLRSLT